MREEPEQNENETTGEEDFEGQGFSAGGRADEAPAEPGAEESESDEV